MKSFVFPYFELLTLSLHIAPAQQHEETGLYSGDGTPVAYITFEDDEPVVYMWSGKPVAYLASAPGSGFNIYGFNGKHLGWFLGGVIRDHDGDAACGVRGVVNSPKIEPFKSFKQFKPFKSFKQFEPSRPSFSRNWSEATCSLFLYEGAK